MAGSLKLGASKSVREKCPGVCVCVCNLSVDYWEGGLHTYPTPGRAYLEAGS